MSADHAAKQLAKLTKTGGTIGAGEGRDTSNSGINGIDVAAAMAFAGLNEMETQAVRLLYAGDRTNEKQFRHVMEALCFNEWRKMNFKMALGQFDLMFDAIYREVYDLGICKTCRGVGKIPTGETSPPITCEPCKGLGRIMITNQKRAEIMGYSYHHYIREWAHRYERMFGVVQDVPDSAFLKLKRTRAFE